MNMDDTYKFSFDDEWKDEMQDAVRQEPEVFADGDLDLEFYDPNRLRVVSGEELSDMRLEPVRFCVEGLLPEGLSILGGAPKAGKSWLVLDLGIRIARGEPIWGIPTRQGDVLYLCLEDSLNRIQDRLNRLTDESPDNLFFAVSAGTIAGNLCRQIRDFKQSHPALSLVVVDTFQVVRSPETEVSYAGDYGEIRQLKALAEELRIALLLVHHLRKQSDRDPLNRLSGSTGLSGAADAVFVLDREQRDAPEAVLSCTGRDIEQRQLRLRFDSEQCTWSCLSDSLGHPEKQLPPQLEPFVDFLRERGSFVGSNTELAEQYNRYAKVSLSPKALKQQMNRWRFLLEDCGVFFESRRSNGTRTVSVTYRKSGDSDGSDAKDGERSGRSICVPCVPCDPAAAP